MQMTSRGSISRVFPGVCGSWIWKPDDGDILPSILGRFAGPRLKVGFQWYGRL